MTPKVSIIILNWNGWKDTIECLESLYQITYPNYNVILIDNGSEDESIEKIKGYCDGKVKVESKFFEYDASNKPIKIIEYTREEAEAGGGKEIADLPPNKKLILIKNEKNYGFAEGNNIGMRYALKALNPDYILLLNNDTVVDKRFLDELVKTAESDEKVGMVGPKIYYYDYNGRTDVINFAGANVIVQKAKEQRYGYKERDGNEKHNRELNVNKLEGSCMMIRKEVLNDVGFFYPDFFAYWEETDLCFRVKKSGYKLVYSPKAKIWHKKSLSGRGVKPLYVYYMTRNRFLFVKRNASWKNKMNFSLYFFMLDMWRLLGMYAIAGGLKILSPFFKGVIDGVIIFIRPL